MDVPDFQLGRTVDFNNLREFPIRMTLQIPCITTQIRSVFLGLSKVVSSWPQKSSI
jgi:hypothetical protein